MAFTGQSGLIRQRHECWSTRPVRVKRCRDQGWNDVPAYSPNSTLTLETPFFVYLWEAVQLEHGQRETMSVHARGSDDRRGSILFV